jgi:C1A family cysteine protease
MASFYSLLLLLFFSMLVLCCLSSSTSSTILSNKLQERFEKWVSQHGKNYSSDTERQHRLKAFADNVNFIENFNRDKKYGYTLSINHFADFTREEFLAKHSGVIPSPLALRPYNQLNQTSVPPSMDWRFRGAVTDIKDQGNCGNVTFFFQFYILYIIFNSIWCAKYIL